MSHLFSLKLGELDFGLEIDNSMDLADNIGDINLSSFFNTQEDNLQGKWIDKSELFVF